MKHHFHLLLASGAILLSSIGSAMAQTAAPPLALPAGAENTPFDNIRSATWDTGDGSYSVHLDEVPAALESGTMQSWCVRVTDAKGKSARNIKLSFTGGMPQHGHGLPSVPATSAGKGKCPYRIDGIEFHMPGVWLIGFDIVNRGGKRHEIRRYVNVN